MRARSPPHNASNQRYIEPFPSTYLCLQRRCRHAEPQAPHSITSSAWASSGGGKSRPSAFAALRLIMGSNFVGCSTGISAGFWPFKALSTSAARRRCSASEKPNKFAPFHMRYPRSPDGLHPRSIVCQSAAPCTWGASFDRLIGAGERRRRQFDGVAGLDRIRRVSFAGRAVLP